MSGWKQLLVVGFAVASAAHADPHASAPANDEGAARVLGNWLTADRDGIVQISVAADGTYQGRIVGGDNPHRQDSNDPDPGRRGLQLRGMIIMHGMRYEGDGKFAGGTIYDPDSGHTYKCHLEVLDNDRIKLHGYIGFSLLGRSQVWTRYLGTSMDLPAAPP